jgi:thiol-disulfide isomerase/thioredoxin
MKSIVKNLVLFLGLSLVLSAFAGCNGTASTESGSSEKKSENVSKDDPEIKEKAKSSEYPPPPKAIATAEIELLNGDTFKLEENEGKVILINLWAIWCGPCIKEMPHLNEMQDKYKDKDFIILGLNTGDDFGQKEVKPNIEKFVDRLKLNYTMGWSQRELTDEFFRLGQMNGIPQSFLIDRDGKLRGMFQGGGPRVIISMKETVEKVVNEPWEKSS